MTETSNVEPTEFAFDAESDAEIAKHLAKYPAGKQASAVLPLLDIAQRQMKRTPAAPGSRAWRWTRSPRRLDMAPIRVYEVATFYLMFNTKPVGTWHLQLCTTTPCWLRGSDDVVAACRKVTGIQGWGETSADGKFTMTEVECVGACVNAPILQVNDDFYEDMDASSTVELLEALKARHAAAGRARAKGRQTSAPEGGPDDADDAAIPRHLRWRVMRCSTTRTASSPTCMACTTGA